MDPSKTVFILGAGFSKAIDQHMPTLRDLAKRIGPKLAADPALRGILDRHTRARIRRGQVPGGNLEIWLSRLDQPGPHLSELDAAKNKVVYYTIANHLVEEVNSAQRATVQSQSHVPQWLERLVRLWHVNGANVITLNYDTLPEAVVAEPDFPRPMGNGLPEVLTIPPPVARSPGGGLRFGPTPGPPSFHLMKLHGSIDLYWQPNDPTGDSIVHRSEQQRWGRPFEPGRQVASDPVLDGREPFIVPPLSVKSHYYALAVVRQQWQRALDALSRAATVVIMGYSLPVSDLAVGALLSESVSGRNVSLAIADLNPKPIVSTLTASGVNTRGARKFKGESAANECVEWIEDTHVRTVPERLRAEIPEWTRQTPDRTVVIRPTWGEVAILRAADIVGQTLVLRAYPPDNPTNANQAVEGIPREHRVLSDQLLNILSTESARITEVCAESDDKRYRVLGGLPTAPGHSEPKWFSLMVQPAPEEA